MNIFGITTAVGKTLILSGDDFWTATVPGSPLVRITGTDTDVSPVPVRSYGLYAQRCSILKVKGILFDYASVAGAYFVEGSCRVEQCKFANDWVGLGVTTSSSGYAMECLAENNSSNGIHISQNTTFYLTNCIARFNSGEGVTINTLSAVNFDISGNYSNNGMCGINAVHNSRALFKNTYSGQLKNNTQYGLEIRYDSYSEQHSKNSFSGNGLGPTNFDAATGGHAY